MPKLNATFSFLSGRKPKRGNIPPAELSPELSGIRKFLILDDSSLSGSVEGFNYWFVKKTEGNRNCGIEISVDFPSPYKMEISYFPRGLAMGYSTFGNLSRFIAGALKSGKAYLKFIIRTDNLSLAKSFCDRNTEYLEKLLEECKGSVKIKDGRISVLYRYNDKDITNDSYRSLVAAGLQEAVKTMAKISKGEG